MKYEPVATGYTTVATVSLVLTSGNIMARTIDLTKLNPTSNF